MASWTDVLDDKKTYPDDTKITLASGVETTLGELRGGVLRQRDYTQKTQELSRDREAFGREKAEFEQAKTVAEQELAALAEKTLAKLAGAQPPGTTSTDDLEAALDADPRTKRLNEKIAAYDKKLADLEARDKTREEAIKSTQQAMWQDWWQRNIAAVKSKDPSLDADAFTKFMQQKRMTDVWDAYRLFTEDRRFEDAIKKVKEDTAKETAERVKRELSQPVLPVRRTVAGLPEDAPKSFDEAAERASKDPEIISIITGQQERLSQ